MVIKDCYFKSSLSDLNIQGFSFDSKSAVPDSSFWAGTPTFQENLTKLHSGTPVFLRECPWNSCFENPSENPDIIIYFWKWNLGYLFNK